MRSNGSLRLPRTPRHRPDFSTRRRGIREHGRVRRFAPELRQTVDYDTLLEMNICGETVAVELAAYAARPPNLATGSVSACRSSLLLALARTTGSAISRTCWFAEMRGPAVDPAVVAAAHEEAVRAHVAAVPGEVHPNRPAQRRIAAAADPLAPQDPDKEIGVIIPTRDNAADVRRIIESLRCDGCGPGRSADRWWSIMEAGQAETRRTSLPWRSLAAGLRDGRALQLVAAQ